MEMFTLKDVIFQYPDGKNNALNSLSLTIEEGEFVAVCGPSGCGKTTFLRLLKREIAPYGSLSGEILYRGKPLYEWEEQRLIEEIGFIFQDPEMQIIMEDVFQEIVFGMENLGLSSLEMRKRTAELVHTFGYEHLLHKKASELSGGQKQILNLLSVLLLKPKVLLLDEPTSQFDPIMAKDLLLLLERLNKELGMTIVIVEHRLEDLFNRADRMIMMDEGKIVYDGRSREVIHSVFQHNDHCFMPYLPSLSLFYLETEKSPDTNNIPLSVKECRKWLSSKRYDFSILDKNKEEQGLKRVENLVVQLEEVYFQYEKDQPMTLRHLSLHINEGDFFGIVGGNGSGKTTLLKVCLGILKPQRGKVKVFGQKYSKKTSEDLYKKIAYLPQNPVAYFVHDTIEKELIEIGKKHNKENIRERANELLEEFGIGHIRGRHPNDCSGGEIQKAALACLLMEEPEILFMDEPTKGLDPISKNRLASILGRLHQNGLTIVIVTHDIEFAAKHLSKCAIMFDGSIAAVGTPEHLFKGNYFYTTMISRATQNNIIPEALTLEEALQLWEKSKVLSF